MKRIVLLFTYMTFKRVLSRMIRAVSMRGRSMGVMVVPEIRSRVVLSLGAAACMYSTSDSMWMAAQADGWGPHSEEFIQAYLARSPVAAAVSSPRSPTSVLNFWFGVDTDTAAGTAQLSDKARGSELSKMHYIATPGFDEACRVFIPVIRELKTSTLAGDADWQTCRGRVAMLLLADQLSRNSFRVI